VSTPRPDNAANSSLIKFRFEFNNSQPKSTHGTENR